MATAARVDLLGVEPERAGEREQLLAQRAGPARARRSSHSADTSQNEQIVNAPSSPRQAVVGLLDPVAQHQAVHGQLVGDRDAPSRATRGSSGGRKRTSGISRQRGVQRGGAVVLREDAPLVDAVGADVVLDLVGAPPASARRTSNSSRIRGQPGAAVGGHPAHDLRRREVLRLAADLPDPAVGLAPVLDRRLDLAATRIGHSRSSSPCRATWCGCTPSRAPRPTRRAGAGRSAPLPIAHRAGALVALQVVEGPPR